VRAEGCDGDNLMGVVLGYADRLLESAPGDGPEREALERIRHAGTRAGELTRQLLAFGRRQRMEPKTLDLDRLLAAFETMARRIVGEHIQLRREVAPGLWPVRADPVQLEQVLMILVVNARDAMPHGGRVVIGVENVVLDQEFVAFHPGASAGAYVRLEVADSGVGMDAATLARAFEPFFTTKPKGQGTGLGLATVDGIVKQSGGFVAVESAPGEGATFSIYLPRHEGEADPAAVAVRAGSPPAPGAGETVLVVEDEPALRRLVCGTLERAGYAVLEAESAAAALAIPAATRARVALLLTDVVLPGLSGPALAARLASERPGLRTLFVSGHSEELLARLGSVGGPLLQKPFRAEALLRHVRELLDAPPPS
jgi:CheY-like chemotaxis protein